MKILHIIPNLRKGGAERLAIDIIRELSRRENITPALILLEDAIEYPVDNIKEYIKVIPSSITLSVFKANKYDVKALQEFVNQFQPDVIHSHLFYADLVSKHISYPHLRYVSHVHDNMPVLQNLSFNTIQNKVLLANFYTKSYIVGKYKTTKNSFIAVSAHTAAYLKDVLPVSVHKRIYELNNAVNFKYFNTADNDRALDKLRLINIGSFQPLKNQMLLVRVVEKLLEKGIDVEATFLGAGATKAEIEQYVSDKNLKNRIHFAGNVNDVPRYLSEANIYVHTSRSESFGLVLIEAMAAGLPVISLNGGGNARLISNGETGYMIDVEDSSIFAERIIEIYGDPKKYQKMRQNAVSFASSFDIASYTDRLIEIYKLTGAE